MVYAGDLRKGVTIEYDGKVWTVVDFLHVKPGKGAAFVRTTLKNVVDGKVLQITFNPTEKFENAVDIADHLREKRTVVLNLEQTNKDVARRLVDFLSGVTYAQDGKIKKVANSTFIITPYNVDILGDLIDELENNGLYI